MSTGSTATFVIVKKMVKKMSCRNNNIAFLCKNILISGRKLGLIIIIGFKHQQKSALEMWFAKFTPGLMIIEDDARGGQLKETVKCGNLIKVQRIIINVR